MIQAQPTARTALVMALLVLALAGGCARRGRDFDVRRFGAAGDGTTLDTAAINKAIEACAAAAGGGRVIVPPGRYLTGTVRLRSHVTLVLEGGAELLGTRDLGAYDHFTPPPDTPLVGDRLPWHRALVLGDGIDDVTITGRGVINGNNVADPAGEEGVRGPHAVLFGNCTNVALRGVSIRDAGNYAVLLEFTDRVGVRDVTVTGGYDGVHLRGWKDRPCRDVTMADCRFYTGDDCIAGWYWQDLTVERCVLNSASNGVRLFGPARGVRVRDCDFFGPGRYLWRTSGPLRHTNMAAGVCVQPSAWGATEGTVDDVRISDVTMRDVATPFHIANKAPSTIGRITIERLDAGGTYRAAASIESWSDEPIGRVDLVDSNLGFVGGFGPVLSDPADAVVAWLTRQSTAVQPPGVNPRPLPAWGLYARHVVTLNVRDVRLAVAARERRPAMIFDGVEPLRLSNVTAPPTTPPMILSNVRQLLRDRQ